MNVERLAPCIIMELVNVLKMMILTIMLMTIMITLARENVEEMSKMMIMSVMMNNSYVSVSEYKVIEYDHK